MVHPSYHTCTLHVPRTHTPTHIHHHTHTSSHRHTNTHTYIHTHPLHVLAEQTRPLPFPMEHARHRAKGTVNTGQNMALSLPARPCALEASAQDVTVLAGVTAACKPQCLGSSLGLPARRPVPRHPLPTKLCCSPIVLIRFSLGPELATYE